MASESALAHPGTVAQSAQSELSFSRPTPDTLCLRFAGSWTLQATLPSPADVQSQMTTPPPVRRLTFNTQDLTDWDSVFLTFLRKLNDYCEQQHIECDHASLPKGMQGLLRLATAVPEHTEARREAARDPLLARLGKWALATRDAAKEFLTFLGQATTAFGKLFVGKARFRRTDLWVIIQEVGAQALPIVSLISFLVGLILAFVGAVQLRQFGAQIYVADLVGIAMAREMGAMMTGIVMAGRTGAAFAAQLGTMTVNEEIDALTTTGLPPMEFLVLPRILALVLMVPLLCVYADLLGILGGAVIGVSMLDLGLVAYFNQTREALTLTTFVLGLIKGAVFGVVVALAGCLRGIQSGRSAAAVGEAATSAVVTAIVWIIIMDAILTFIYEVLGV